MLSLLKTCLLTAAAGVLVLGSTVKAATRIDGAGATFPQPLYNKWIEEYSKVNPSIKISYGGEGSGAGPRRRCLDEHQPRLVRRRGS